MKNLLFVLNIFLFSLYGYAQEFEVKGKVTDGEIPLKGAIVRVSGTSVGTSTNENGEYSLTLEKGSYNLIFVYGNRKEITVDLSQDRVVDIDLSDAQETLEEVFLSAVRVGAQSPVTHSNMSQEEISNRNLGQDIPSLLNYLPGVVSTSDAGAGIGYTSIRVRGSDASRVNVTINGIPYNDSESQGSFWVNLGDFASSVESLQLQRGVGSSTNGAGAFGASLNIRTERYQLEPSAELASSVGSYGTFKNTAKFSTGLFREHWEFAGRASSIKSDGYVDRASSNLKSYFLQGTYVNGNTLIKALTFAGSEVTYQSWDGITADLLETDRRYNPAGAFTDDNGDLRFYDNHVDDYKQDNYQLLWNQKYGTNWSTNLALHYTYGRGFYESYRTDQDFSDYGLEPFNADGQEVASSDLVTRKWLDNDFFGTTFNLNYKSNEMNMIFGGAWNKYIGDHFGEIAYARFARLREPDQLYYDNTAYKTDGNLFAKADVALNSKFSLFGDLQLRRITYETEGVQEGNEPFEVNDSHLFFNPKGGLTYDINSLNQMYFSFARAHREPSRNDYEGKEETDFPKPEELNDYELGWRFKTQRFQVNTNLYFMDYRNQLVLTGEVDNVGAFKRQNSGSSYRLGLEVDAVIRLLDNLILRPNISLSRNKNDEFHFLMDGELGNFGDTDISYSPEIVAANIIEFEPVENFEVRFLSKYVGEQYMSNIEAEGSKLESFFVNDLNLQYTWKKAPLFKEVVFTGLVNNIFNELYVSNGYYFTYDLLNPITYEVKTYDGAGYYPQAETNFLAGVTLKF